MSINRRPFGIGPLPLLGLGLAGLAALIGLAIPTLRHWRETPPPPPPSPPALRLDVPDLADGNGVALSLGLAASPDGRRLVFAVTSAGRPTFWLRHLVSGTVQPLPLTEGATLPFWSPDGTRIGYFAGGQLRVLDVDAGTDNTVAAAPAPRGGAWLASGDIIFAPDVAGALVRWRADAGSMVAVTALDVAAGETSHGLPVASRDGQHLIFQVRATTPARAGIWWAPIDRLGERRRLVGSDAHGLLANGHLLFANDGALMAQPIDLDTGVLGGRATMLATPVGHGSAGQLFASAGAEGPLFYAPPQSAQRVLSWVDRSGTALGTVGGPADSWDLRVAPAGSRPAGRRERVAVTQADAQLGTLDVWAYDGARPLPLRISAAIEADDQAVWSPDAARLAWVQGRRTVVTRGAQAVLPDEIVRRFETPVRLWDWSRDGRWLVVGLIDASTRDDLWLLPAHGDGELRALIRSPFRDTDAAVSPDGAWIAYASDESGLYEIYLDMFPTPTRRRRLTLGGGVAPRWRGDGRELFFRRDRAIHAIGLSLASPAAGLEATATTQLFETPGDIRAYDATTEGTRFLLNLPAAATAPALHAIVNWRSLTEQHAP